MAHEISVTDGIEEMMYVGERPWHGLGTQLEDLATASEAIEAAHLGWSVLKREMFWKNASGEMVPSGHFTTVRDDNEQPLGIVSSSYKIVQNVEAFDFMDSLVDTGEAKYETAGALFRGRKIWMLAKLPTTIEVVDGDSVEKYLLLMNTHDGSESVKVIITPVRVVCNNTLTLAMSGAELQARIIHTGDIQSKVNEARRILGITLKGFEIAEGAFRGMSEFKIDDDGAKQYFSDVMEKDTSHFEKIRSNLMSLYKEGPTAEMGAGTLWGAYNAITDWVDHYRGHRSNPDKVFHSTQLGSGMVVKRKAYRVATSMSSAA